MTEAHDQQGTVDRYFDRTASHWLDVYHGDGLEAAVYRQRLATATGWISELGLPAGAAALEVGCGAGLAALALARSGLTVTATDSSPEMTRLARATSERAAPGERFTVLKADAHRLPFADESFQLVVALGLLPWLHDERSALAEMARVLRHGAWIVLTADNRWRLNMLIEPRENPLLAPLKPLRRARRSAAASADAGAPSRRHRPREVDELLAGAGLDTIRRTTVGYGPFTALGRPLLPDAAGIRLHARLTALSAGRLAVMRRMGWHYLVVARKERPPDPPRARATEIATFEERHDPDRVEDP